VSEKVWQEGDGLSDQRKERRSSREEEVCR